MSARLPHDIPQEVIQEPLFSAGNAGDALLIAAFAANADGVIVIDADLRVARMNPAAVALTGWDEAGALGRWWYEIIECVPPESTSPGPAGGPPNPGSWPIELRHRSGHRHQLTARFEPVRDSRSVAVLATLITLHRHDPVLALQSALDRSEQRLHIALERGQVGLWEWHAADDTFREYGAWVGRTSHTAHGGSCTGRELLEHTHPDDVAAVSAALRAHLRGESATYEVEQRVRLVDGGYVYFLARGQTVERDANGKSVKLIGTYTEIGALKTQAQRLKIALENGREGLWEWEPEADQVTFSPEWYAMLGYPEGSLHDACGECTDIVHPDDRLPAIEALLPMLRGERDDFQVEQRYRHHDGHYLYLLSRGSVLERSPDGRVQRVLGTHVDITTLKETQARLIESRGLLETVIDAFPQRVFWKDLDNRYLGGNHRFAYDAGLASADELAGRQVQNLGWPDGVDCYLEDDQLLTTGLEQKLVVERAFQPIRGEAFWCETTKVALRGPDGAVTGILGMYDDVSNRRQRERQLEVVANALTSGRQSRLLNALTRAAAELADADYAFVARLHDGNSAATVTACYPSRKPLRNWTYSMAGTPCAFTMGRNRGYFVRDLPAQFSQSELLDRLQVTAYAGQQLKTPEGQVIGIFSLLFKHSPPDEDRVRAVLDIFAARATAELDRERTHADLLASERRLNAAMASGSQGIWEWELDSDQMTTMGAHFLALGYDSAPRSTTGMMVTDRIHPDDRTTMREALHAYFRGTQATYEREVRMCDATGDYHWTLIRGEACERDSAGRVTRMIGTHTDISALKAVQSALERSQDFLELIIDTVPQAIFWQDRDFRYLGCNARFAAMAGVARPEDIVGKRDAELWWAESSVSFITGDLPLLAGTLPYLQVETKLADNLGGTQWAELIKVPMRDSAGTIIGLLGAIHDISARKEAQDRAQRLALYDPLTNLPNRRYFTERLEASLAAATRRGTTGALLFIDMDQFKRINDSLGHSVGDGLLQAVGQRLQNVTRQEDMVARLGGDEFVILLPDLATTFETCARQARLVAEKIHDSLGQPFQFERHQFHVTPTIGISLFPEPGKGVDTVLKEADTAMYSGKADGRNVTRFFRPEMDQGAQQRLRIETDIRKALANHEFELYFQPQVDGVGRVTGAEALLRWNHPEQGMISPGVFIPVAEERGLIVDLGRWVLRAALASYRGWLDSDAVAPAELSVNVSSRQFRADDFVLDVERLLEEFRIPAHRIVLELTEGTVIEDVGATIAVMERLRRLGMKFAVDDFGVGYSSLSYLKRLPIDQLKIDRSFIADIGQDQNDEVICQTIIAMGRHLGLQTVAEGVETAAQFAFLQQLDCNRYQGYYFLEPAPAEIFIAYCRNANPA